MFDPAKMVGKGVSRLIQVIIAFLAAKGVLPVLTNLGIQINPDQLTLYLTGLAVAGFEMLRNYLKVKLNWKFL